MTYQFVGLYDLTINQLINQHKKYSDKNIYKIAIDGQIPTNAISCALLSPDGRIWRPQNMETPPAQRKNDIFITTPDGKTWNPTSDTEDDFHNETCNYYYHEAHNMDTLHENIIGFENTSSGLWS